VTFDQLVKKLPMCLVGSWDPLAHTTISDLAFIARHELDLYEEGQENDICTSKDLKECKAFLALCRSAEKGHRP
jgi:hypothetical protein